MKKSITFILGVVVFFMLVSSASGEVRLKDIAIIKDQRKIQLKGLGLVTGLNGTGDTKTTQFTIRMIGNMMRLWGLDVPAGNIKVKNAAAVSVTATVSPYVKVGGTFDVNVSSLGDAKSLEGGTLLLTMLSDTDDLLYAKVQGPVSVGGTNKDFGGAGGVVENALLSGTVPGGGILEREVPTLGIDEKSLTVTLRSPDYTTAFRLASAVNDYFIGDLAVAQDAGSIIVSVPDEYADNDDMVKFISELESISFEPDVNARVVINERTGTVITGNNVSLAPVAVMHGTLSLTIGAQDTALEQETALNVIGQNGDRMVTFRESVNVSQIARSLNMLGVTPRDLIAIFQALKVAGSLRAELIII